MSSTTISPETGQGLPRLTPGHAPFLRAASPQRWGRCLPVLLASGLVFQAAGAAEAPPPPGRHAAQLCVGPLDTPLRAPDCGPADAVVQRGNRLQVRISDIVYRFELRSSQVDVMLMHGSMQIDGFTAPYEWHGGTLRVDDLDKRTRYQVKFLGPQRAGQ